MNKQEMNLLNELRLLIEERNALRADKEALIDALRHSVSNCDHCQHQNGSPCNVQEGHALDCVTCADACPCKDCRNGSRFEWIGRSPRGKHAAPEHPLPVGVKCVMEAERVLRLNLQYIQQRDQIYTKEEKE